MNQNANTFDNQSLLAECKKAVELKLSWGNSADWQTQDYERLSDRIFDDTTVRLSASTLKRIWGKVQYNSTPNLSTLDALTAFAGHTDWRTFADFQEKQLQFSNAEFQHQPATVATSRSTPFSFRLPLILLLIAGSGLLIGFVLVGKSSRKLSYRNIHFSSRPVTKGLPNTVIFEYDAADSNADSVFIQQNWDERRRFRVDKQQHLFTSTYYLPGFYRAKLIFNDSVVKEHDLLIESEGWVGAILGKQAPIYLNDSVLQQQNGFGISIETLKQLNVDTKQAPSFILSNVSKQTGLRGDDFLLDLQVQNTYPYTNAVCRKTEILVHGTRGVISIPLCEKGCVGEINLLTGSKMLTGKTNDLSGFGVDFTKPVQLKCEVKEKRIRIDINGRSVFNEVFEDDLGTIVGTRFQFEGTGEISNMRLVPATRQNH